MPRTKRTIGLETYQSFFENPHDHYQYLTISQLNQIIYIHGFGKVHRTPKCGLIGALSTMDLLIPLRSTLKENVSSDAPLTIERLKEDLDILEWQECPVQSVETVKLPLQEVQGRYQKTTAGGNLLPSSRFGHTKRLSETEMAFSKMTKKPRSKRKRGSRLKAGAGAGSTSTSTTTTTTTTTTSDANLTAIADAATAHSPIFADLLSSTVSMAIDWCLLKND